MQELEVFDLLFKLLPGGSFVGLHEVNTTRPKHCHLEWIWAKNWPHIENIPSTGCKPIFNVIYSSVDRGSYKWAQEQVNKLLESYDHKSVIVVGTHLDKPDYRKVPVEEVINYCEGMGVAFFGVGARLDRGVESLEKHMAFIASTDDIVPLLV